MIVCVIFTQISQTITLFHENYSLHQWFLTFSPPRPPEAIFLWLTPPLL